MTDMKTGGYFSLTPKNLDEKERESVKEYITAIDYAYKNSEIKNIAITGPYGSGKSSLWKTYSSMEKFEKDDVIEVSLPDFEESGSNDGEFKSSVERQIINQIIYQINPDKVKGSKYSIIKSKTERDRLFSPIEIKKFILGISLITFKSLIGRIFENISFMFNNNFYVLDFGGEFIAVIVGFFLILNPAIKAIHWLSDRENIQFIKLNLKIAEFTTKEKLNDSDKSLIDLEMKDLVYLILNSESHTIIFEDLDRHSDITLFERLRELNYLVNKQSDKTIRFFYMIRDDIFSSKDRTKFFDFIIPIIPIINTENSKGKMIEVFEGIEPSLMPDKRFLERISMYIDDMRLMYSIRNEYEIYSQTLEVGKLNLNRNKLLSIIVLKNIFPKEYDLLHKNQGYIYSLFQKKYKETEQSLSDIDNQITKKQKQYKFQKQNSIRNKYDLIAKFIPSNVYIYDDITWSKFLEAWSNSGESERLYGGSFNGNYYYNDFVQIIEKDEKYIEYLKSIEELGSGTDIEELDTIKEKVKSLKEQKSLIGTMSLSDLLKLKMPEDLYEFFSLSKSQSKAKCDKKNERIQDNHYFPLIQFLIMDGYLDETYWNYMGHYHENSLSLNDNRFLMSLFGGIPEPENFELDNPGTVLDNLDDVDFNRPGIFNLSLLNELIKNDGEERIYWMTKTVIKTSSLNQLNAFYGYLDGLSSPDLNFYIGTLIEYKIELAMELFQKVHEKDLAIKIIYSLYVNEKKLPVERIFTDEFIESNSYILEAEHIEDEIEFLRRIGNRSIKFKNISKLRVNEEIARHIEKEGLYEVSVENLNNLVTLITDDTTDKSLETLLKTLRYGESFAVSRNQISDEEIFLLDYVSILKEGSMTSLNGFEELVRVMDSDIQNSTKVEYLEVDRSTYKDIKDAKKIEMWPKLVEMDKIDFSSYNIDEYWTQVGKVEVLLAYLNRNHDQIDKIDFSEELANTIIKNSKANIKVIERALKYATDIISEVNEDMSIVTLKLLIKHQKLSLSLENLNVVLDKEDSELLGLYIEVYSDSIITFMIENNIINKLSNKTVSNVLQNNLTDNGQSILLLDSFEGNLSLVDLRDSNNVVLNHYVEFKLSNKDIKHIIEAPKEFICWKSYESRLVAMEEAKDELAEFEWDNDFITLALNNFKNRNLKAWLIEKSLENEKYYATIFDFLSNSNSFQNLATVLNNKQPILSEECEIIIGKKMDEIGWVSFKPETNKLYLKPSTLKKLNLL